MVDVLLFHHAQGLTDGVEAFADRLRAAGHRVTVPDLYDGRTFPTVDAGVAHAERLGSHRSWELVRRAGGQLFRYEGDAHLFTDSSLDEHHPSAAQLVIARTLAFLDALD